MLGPALDATRQRDHLSSSSSNSGTSSRLATSIVGRTPIQNNQDLGPPPPEAAGTYWGTLEGLYGLPCALFIYLFVFH